MHFCYTCGTLGAKFYITSPERLLILFSSYTPPITAAHHTCVGLALELWKELFALRHQFPELSDHLYLVSCEEDISLIDYVALYEDLNSVINILEKEHVLLALKFEIAGREGVLLCDPGYHVGRVVTVMLDQKYPHTGEVKETIYGASKVAFRNVCHISGWFTQSQEKDLRKEYCYTFSAVNCNFVEWTARNTKSGLTELFSALIYVEKQYLTAIDVTERRNLVYNFRSLLSRDMKGHLLAGVYFRVVESGDEFTVFYECNGKQRVKMNFSMFQHPDLVRIYFHKLI